MPYGENSQQQLTHVIRASHLKNACKIETLHGVRTTMGGRSLKSFKYISEPDIFVYGLSIDRQYDYCNERYQEWIKIKRRNIQPEQSGMEKTFHVTSPIGTHDLFTDYYEEIYRLSYQLEYLEEERKVLAHFDLDKSQATCVAFDTLRDEIPERISSILESNLMTYQRLMSGQYRILHPILAKTSVNRTDRKGIYKSVCRRNTDLKNLFDIDKIDFIQTDGKNYYSVLPPSEALVKLEDVLGSHFEETWNELLKLESYNETLNSDCFVLGFGYANDRNELYLPTGRREDRDSYYGSKATFCLDHNCSLDIFDNDFALEVRESIEDEIKSFNEYQKRAQKLYPKYGQMIQDITERLQELTNEPCFLAVVESVNEATAIEEEKERFRIREQDQLREEAAEKARVEKAEKHEIWLVDFSTRKQGVRNTGVCGCTDRKGKSKDNYPTKADAYEVAAKQMKKTDGLELDVYECDEGENDSYNRFHGYGGWHLTRNN